MNRMIVEKVDVRNHFHAEVEVVYVIRGKIEVRIQDSRYHLKEEDIMVINSGISHSITELEESIVCIVRYSPQLVSEMLRRKEFFFLCCSSTDDGRPYDRLRDIFGEIILEYIDEDRKSECLEKSLLYKLLDCLAGDFLAETDKKDGERGSGADERLRQILDYIYQNFRDEISLSELAERMFTSKSTLSRYFRKETGIYFADYVNQVRMRYALQELTYSDSSITKVAVESGFSNLSAFNRVFKETYKMTPSEYRKKEKRNHSDRREEEEKLRRKLKQDFSEKQDQGKDTGIRICVDAMNTEKYEKVWGKAVNAGSANTLLLANSQYHIEFLKETLGFRYVRIWNLFSTQMMVTDGIHIGNYSYDKIDIVLDFLDDHGIYPFIDFGIRPVTALKNENTVVYFDEECVEFQSREIWEDLISSFMEHVLKRYGEEKVENWIFELAFDQSHKKPCYKDDNYQFFNAYQHLYTVVKRLVPKAKVGGPMGIVNQSQEFIEQFLEDGKKYRCVPDFVSIVLFPYISSEKDGKSSNRRSLDHLFEENQIRKLEEMLERCGVGSKIYVSEWNMTLSSRNYLNDSCYRAAYFADKLERIWNKVDLISVWMASDWVSNYFDIGGVANGGNGLLTKDTICKPAYYSLQFMNSLGDYLIGKGSHYIITKTEKQDYYILCSNYKNLGGSYFLNKNDANNPSAIKNVYENEEPVNLEIVLHSMRADRYVVKKRTVSPKEGSLLCEWEKFDYDMSLNSQEVKYIRQICFPRLSMRKVKTKDGTLSLRETIEPHEIVLIHIYEE